MDENGYDRRAKIEGIMEFNHISIIGAGVMGAGIAHTFAASNKKVVLMDVSPAFVDKGMERIREKCVSDVNKGKLRSDEKDLILSRISGTVDLREAKHTDLVIEAVIEDRKIKGDVFQALHQVCSPQTVFATNTSTLSITDLATLSGRPGRFLGIHFFNPVHAMKLVEVIPGLDTEKEVVETATSAVRSIKKTPIVVQDCPGFLVNRMQLAYMNEAMLFVEKGMSPQVIDHEARKAGFPMGPLELVDWVGIDVDRHVWPIMHEAYPERFPVPLLSQKLYDAGRLGVKTGKGIYSKGKIDDEFTAIVKNTLSPVNISPFSVEVLILRQVNEAVYCLQEAVASAEEIDRAMVLATGFPNQGGIGGPLHWADERGLDWVLSTLKDLSSTAGTRFWPHHLLKTYVSAGRLGRKTGKGFFEYS